MATGDEAGDTPSPASGEVTAGVVTLPNLLMQDELEAGEQEGPRRWPSLAPTTPRPSRSPGAPSEASPLPESWDLFMQFKKIAPRPSTMSAGVPDRSNIGEEAEAGAGSQNDREVCLPFTSAAVSVPAGTDDPRRRSASFGAAQPSVGHCFSFSDEGAAIEPDAAERRSSGDSQLPVAGGAGEPSPPRRAGRGCEDTIDMAGFAARIREGSAGHAAAEADESEVPEGRKSFAARLLARGAGGGPLEGGLAGSRPGSPSAGRQSGELPGSPEAAAGPGSNRSNERSQVFDFERMNNDFDLKAGLAPSGVDVNEGNSGFAVDTTNRGTGCSSAGNQYPPGLGLLAGLGAQPHDRRGRGSGARAHAQGRSSQGGGTSEVMDSILHCSFISTESAPLPGASSLHPIPHAPDESSNHSGFNNPMVWDEFLSHCGISFPPEAATGMNTDTVVIQVPEAPRGHRPGDLLAHRRSLCLRRVHEDLDERNRMAAQTLDGQVQRWNHAGHLPPAAVDLLQAMETERDLKPFLARAKSLQAESKSAAWLQWYAIKHDWILKDLKVNREHTASLRQEDASLRECVRDLERHAKNIEAALRHQRARCELLRSQRQARSSAREDLRAAQEARQLARRRSAEAREALRLERAAVRGLGQSLEDARYASRPDGVEDGGAQGYLQKRLRRVQLQMLRGMRTCLVSDRATLTSTSLELSLRGGARARVARPLAASIGCLARVSLEQPPLEAPAGSIAGLRPGAQALRKLARELFACAWQGLVGKLPHSATVALPTASALELTVPCSEVLRLVRRLDYAAVRVWDQIEALRKARKGRPEVVQLDARLRSAEPGLEPTLAIAASLLLEHCAVRVGSEAKVHASKVVVEFTADLANFPEAINWSDISVRQVFGHGEAPAVARALRCCGSGGGLAEALAAAVEAMRRAA